MLSSSEFASYFGLPLNATRRSLIMSKKIILKGFGEYKWGDSHYADEIVMKGHNLQNFDHHVLEHHLSHCLPQMKS